MKNAMNSLKYPISSLSHAVIIGGKVRECIEKLTGD